MRRLWSAFGLASPGDWLGLLALAGTAWTLAGGSYRSAGFAIGAVLLLRTLPPTLLGPLGDVVVDRRHVHEIAAGVRALLYLSIPIVGNLAWLYVATALLAAVSLAARRSWQRVDPPVVGALIFVVLTLVNEAGTALFGWFGTPADLACVGAAILFGISVFTPSEHRTNNYEHIYDSIVEGWSFVRRNQAVRRLTIACVIVLAAVGGLIGVGPMYAADIDAALGTFGMMVVAFGLGSTVGGTVGPRLLEGLSRWRAFGLAVTGAGAMLILIGLVPSSALAVLFALLLGGFAGLAWTLGHDLIELEVGDAPRVFATVRGVTRLALAIALPGSAVVAGLVGPHDFDVPGNQTLSVNGAAIVLIVAGVLVAGVGALTYRTMDDRRGVSLRRDLKAFTRSGEGGIREVFADHGLFIAFEGGEGVGKSTQVRLLATWLETAGYDVIVTHQPGATDVGKEIRQLLLHRPAGFVSARAEALLFAADKAEHVDTVVRPALDRGAVVLTDRYVDSTLAYQGAGRDLGQDEVLTVSRWATRGLQPHLTVVLDLESEEGLGRVEDRNGTAGPGGVEQAADRVEQEPAAFHRTVRRGFLELAALDPDRYAVVDASQDPDEVAARVRALVEPLLSRVRRKTGW